jgi:hypothetical protein
VNSRRCSENVEREIAGGGARFGERETDPATLQRIEQLNEKPVEVGPKDDFAQG